MVTIWKLWMTEDKPQHFFKKRLHQRCLIMSQYASAFLSLFSFQKQPPQVFYKKDVLKKFAIFTRNHLYWNLFFKKLFNKTPLLKNIFKRPLLSLPCLQTVSSVSPLREKCLNTLVRIFPHSDWILRDTLYLPVVSPNAGKYGPEKIPVVEAITWLLIMVEFRLYSQLLRLSIFLFRSKLLIHFIKSKESWTTI